MKVGIVFTRDDATAVYRCYFPGRVLFHQGNDVDIKVDVQTFFDASTHKPVDVDPQHDVVVFPRPLNREILELIPLLQARGVAVVVEIDDNTKRILPTHKSWKAFHPKHSLDYNWKIMEECASLADRVTCTTPALAEEFAPHGRVTVIPNYVPESYLSMRPEKERAIGWGGAVDVHPGDLNVLGGSIVTVTKEFDLSFRHIGTGDAQTPLGLSDDYFEQLTWQPITEYPLEVARFAVGVVPLQQNDFNAAKSWLKGIEYAALGVPFVASPTPEYNRLNALGAGLLAAKPREWQSKLKELVSNRERWLEVREAGIEVAQDLTYEKNAWRWMEAWEQALEHRKQFPARTDPVPQAPTKEEYFSDVVL